MQRHRPAKHEAAGLLLGPHRRRQGSAQPLDPARADGVQHAVELGGRAVALDPESGLVLKLPVVHAVADACGPQEAGLGLGDRAELEFDLGVLADVEAGNRELVASLKFGRAAEGWSRLGLWTVALGDVDRLEIAGGLQVGY